MSLVYTFEANFQRQTLHHLLAAKKLNSKVSDFETERNDWNRLDSRLKIAFAHV